jgi:hypothetical protein
LGSNTCPRCGGPATVEGETWTRSDRTVSRSLLCTLCGSGFTVRTRSADSRPPWAVRVSPGRRLVWIPGLLLALWLVLRVLPYGDRADVYAALSTVLEGFLHPVWAGVLVAACLGLWIAFSGSLPRKRGGEPSLAPDVHVREEGPGKLAVVISSTRGGAARDFVVDRRPSEEDRILGRLSEIAARSTAFADVGTGSGGVADRRELRDEVQREVHSLGIALGETLLGCETDARAQLFDLPGDHLLLRIQPGLARVPWELIVARRGAQFLWQQYHLARQVRGESDAHVPRMPPAGPLRMLLLANLEFGSEERALPAAEAEAAEILDLAAREPGRLRVVRRTPHSADELKAFLREGFDVVHFAGHAEQIEGGGGWVLAGGDVVDPASASIGAGGMPVLVFANACRSGPGASAAPRGGGTALELMRAGAGAYVGAIWELDDRGSADFARIFYRALLCGATVGESMTAARSALLGLRAFTWANYALYGDPTLVLIPGAREESGSLGRQV